MSLSTQNGGEPKNRVAIFLPNLHGGGAERASVNIANGLIRHGHHVDMVLLRAEGELLRDLNSQVRLVNLGVGRTRFALIGLIRYLKTVRPGALLAVMWPLTIIAVLARMCARIPCRVVVAEHTTWSKSELLTRPTVSWQVRTSMKWLFSASDGIVSVSQGAADDLAQFTGLNRALIRVIYNPVIDTAGIDSISLPNSPVGWCRGSHKRILAVGTLAEVKDHKTLLKAFAQLVSLLDARLLILGEGRCRTQLEEQARGLGIQDRLFMPGFVKDTAPYYQHADLHVLSSRAEGLPTVLIEALASGTPIVSTDCPSGPREILRGGEFGRLVPVGDAHALSMAIAESLSTTHERAPLKKRANDFSIEKSVNQYEALLFPKRNVCDSQ